MVSAMNFFFLGCFLKIFSGHYSVSFIVVIIWFRFADFMFVLRMGVKVCNVTEFLIKRRHFYARLL